MRIIITNYVKNLYTMIFVIGWTLDSAFLVNIREIVRANFYIVATTL